MLLPLRYNDGRTIEEERIHQTCEELILRFEALTVHPGFVQGSWVHEAVRYDDDFRRVMVDVEDVPENHEFFTTYKAVLCERFEQIEIYISSYLVDIV